MQPRPQLSPSSAPDYSSQPSQVQSGRYQQYYTMIPETEDSHLRDETILLTFLIVAVMSIFTAALFVIMLKRSFHLRRYKIYRVFLAIALYIGTKIFTCTILLCKIIVGIPSHWDTLTAASLEIIFKDSLIFAEMALVSLFMVVFEYYVVVCLNPLGLFSRHIPFFIAVSQIVQAAYLIASVVLLLLLNLDTISYEVLNIYSVAINSVLIVLFVSSFFYLTFQMTGVMLPTRRHERINKVYKLLLFLLLSRFITSAIQWLILFEIKDGNFSGFITLIKQKQDSFVVQSVIFISYMVYILLTEGLPMMYCMQGNNMPVFFIAPTASHFADDTLTDDLNPPNLSQVLYSNSILEAGSPEIVSLSSFIDIQPLPIETSIWGYYKGMFKGRVYFIRKSYEKISSYLVEDAVKEIIGFREKNIRELNPMGYFVEEEFFFIFEPYRSQNLEAYLQTKPTPRQRLKIMEQLAGAIALIHENGVVHGCLTPRNIFVQGAGPDLRIIFSGYGLNSFRRYLSMTTDYTNKTAYSAAEHLQNSNPVIIRPKKQADIYSLGMILYQCMSDNHSYSRLSARQLSKMIVEQNSRPKIPQNMQEELKMLIRRAWAKEAHLRPGIGEIKYQLRELARKTKE